MEEDQFSVIIELTKELDASAMSASRTMHHINLTYKFNSYVLHELTLVDTERHVKV